MPWEKERYVLEGGPTDNSGMEQVGTVYTAEGFEFDYIGAFWRAT